MKREERAHDDEGAREGEGVENAGASKANAKGGEDEQEDEDKKKKYQIKRSHHCMSQACGQNEE